MLEHIDLKKNFEYGFRYCLNADTDTIIVYCPDQRLDDYDFEFGLTHELTEATLRLVVKELENYWISDDNSIMEVFHISATLSLPRYDFIAHFYDFLEAEFVNGKGNKQWWTK